MDDNLLFIREAQSVFADKGDGKGLTVHGFFSTGPVHKLIFSLQAPKEKKSLPESVKKINVTMGYPLRASELYMPIAYPDNYFSPMPTTGEEIVLLLRKHWKAMQTPANGEAYYQLTKALDHIEECMTKHLNVVFSAEAVIQFLRMLTMQSTIPYAGEPLNGLQVMGVLETRALDFDNLIITGFNDDLYPGRTHSNSFIPYILRRGFGLPTPERQDAICAYNFVRTACMVYQQCSGRRTALW